MTPGDAGDLIDAAARATHGDPAHRLDLAHLALAFSVLARPDADIAPQLAHLDALAARLAGLAGRNPVEALAGELAGSLGYAGDDQTYEDMVNADLAAVIERRRGLPVALGILYCHAARAAGWDAAGLNFPSHFLIRVDGPGGRHILDPFHGGRAMDAGGLRQLLRAMNAGDALLPEHHRDVADRQVLLRLQNNIKLRRLHAGDIQGGLDVLGRMRRLAPDISALAVEEAAVLAESGAYKGAAATLRAFLEAGHAEIGERAEMERFLASIETRLN